MVDFFFHVRRKLPMAAFLLACVSVSFSVLANPVGGQVTHGSATISSSGSVMNINQSSANAYVTWQSFNIGSGQTVNFNQPSASSVTWNQINDTSASQILGTINANGYVVLQNQNGFYIGGSATINAHSLIMTTASTPMANLFSGGSWSFSAPPPTAQIVNYGQINITGGGSAFLIAADIVNNGSITAPNGNIGLYAGENVLVSTSPDGRGLSALVTLPKGSVDNEGKLIADGGTIAAQAQYVNQNGVIQANSVQNNNGTIELVASDDLTIGANSKISANGDPSATSPSEGGFIILSAGNAYSDKSSSIISASGTAGGQDGVVELLYNGPGSVNSIINDNFAVMINPYDMTISGNPTDTSSSNPNINVNDLSAYSKIDLWSLDNIEVSTFWVLPNPSMRSSLNLNAGNNIIIDPFCGIGTGFGQSGYDWDFNFMAGTQLPYGTLPTAGNDGIYLNGDADIYTLSGNINLWAANEVIVGGGDIGAITTYSGGNISVTTEYGDVNTGNNVNGYDFNGSTYTVDPSLGGISTYAGGNVNISAGGDVISYLPVQNDWNNAQHDGGTGAFGPEPGNVTITAGGNVYGHYVVANGIGTITAGGNVGAVPGNNMNLDAGTYGFALSLINGSWNVFAPNGSIYLQAINNPSGIFGNGSHHFDYSSSASVLLDAGNNIEFTGFLAPQSSPDVAATGVPIPIILPPSLTVIAGNNFTLDTSFILFPSPDQNLSLDMGGNFAGPNGNPVSLEMSDSAATSWIPNVTTTFGPSDHASAPPELNNPNPVNIFVGGNVQDVNLYVDEVTQMKVIGNMMDSSFIGENLHASDDTVINVTGSIEFSPLYAFEQLPAAITSSESSQPNTWDSVFNYAINPADVQAVQNININDSATKAAITAAGGLAGYLNSLGYLVFGSSSKNAFLGNPGFVYDPTTKQFGFKGPMPSALANLLTITPGDNGALSFAVLSVTAQGTPNTTTSGNLQTASYTLYSSTTTSGINSWNAAISSLYSQSQHTVNLSSPAPGFQIGGPGTFTINAGSIDLGYSEGIVSSGFGTYGIEAGAPNYSSLESVSGTVGSGGAAVNVNVAGDLEMTFSTIASLDGGDVTINAGGNVNLSQGDFVLGGNNPYGIWTSGHSDVKVVADGDINVGTSRIATFNGGNVFVESMNGSVDCGSGANIALNVWGIYLNASGVSTSVEFGNLTDSASLAVDPTPYGSGIMSEYPTAKYQTAGATGPGDITVLTPKGNITSTSGSVFELALHNEFAGGTVTITAGTKGVDPTPQQGNIDLGGAVVGGSVNITATGKTHVVAVARQNLNLTTKEFSGIVLAGQNANVTAQSSDGPAIVIGIGSVDASGLGNALLLGQSVSVDGGTSQSTLGTSVTASSSSQAAAQQGLQQAAQVATVVNTSSGNGQDNKKKPKIKVGRVTVILSSAAPLQKNSTLARSAAGVPAVPEKNPDLIARTQ